VGAFADATVFSFAPFKPLGCVGNGGMVTTDREEIARRLRLLVGYGHTLDRQAETPGHQMHVGEGYNIPLDPVQAGLLTVKLPHLEEWTEKRRRIAASYERGLQSLDVGLPTFRPESDPTFRSYTILVDRQQEVYKGLRKAGVEAVLHYTPPIYEQSVYDGDGLLRRGNMPVTERVTESLMCLPVTPELTETDVEYVVETLHKLV
jgi:dTDP-4-amino-4,6-dideoxygalactose transaminase